MRLPRELAWTAALAVPVTAGYLMVARGGPPAASGLVGHSLGVIGFTTMAAGSAGYTWRKRRNGPGSMQRWLEAHAVTGLIGPYLILLHTGFAFRGVAGATFLLLAVVVASGLVGRYAYTRIPKPPPDYAANRSTARRAALTPAPSRSHAEASDIFLTAVKHGIAAHHELEEQAHAAVRRRRALALWWLLHVPVAIVVFALALVHVLAALYYATLLR